MRQWPVGGTTEVEPTCLLFFAARFSLTVLPGFFPLSFWGDLLDIATFSLSVRMVVGPPKKGGACRTPRNEDQTTT